MKTSAFGILARLDLQSFIGWEELAPAGLDGAELASVDVVGEMLDVDLDPRARRLGAD
jgi:hypothetical protein